MFQNKKCSYNFLEEKFTEIYLAAAAEEMQVSDREGAQ